MTLINVSIIQAVCTWVLMGLIWTIQWVHYPMFSFFNTSTPTAFQDHQRRITYLVGPLMVIELFTAVLLAILNISSHPYFHAINIGLLIIIWAHTGVIMVPLHTKLSTAPNLKTIQLLVKKNYVRSVAWTLKGGLWGAAACHLVSR
jgi:hypothetical protein